MTLSEAIELLSEANKIADYEGRVFSMIRCSVVKDILQTLNDIPNMPSGMVTETPAPKDELSRVIVRIEVIDKGIRKEAMRMIPMSYFENSLRPAHAILVENFAVVYERLHGEGVI